MWFKQTGRTWLGPWFLAGIAPAIIYAGIMRLTNLAAATLALEDTNDGSLTVTDR